MKPQPENDTFWIAVLNDPFGKPFYYRRLFSTEYRDAERHCKEDAIEGFGPEPIVRIAKVKLVEVE